MLKFQIGKKYQMRSACDSNCIWEYEVQYRTEKTVKLMDTRTYEAIKCRVKAMDDVEIVYPLGKYSMAPILRAVV